MHFVVSEFAESKRKHHLAAKYLSVSARINRSTDTDRSAFAPATSVQRISSPRQHRRFDGIDTLGYGNG